MLFYVFFHSSGGGGGYIELSLWFNVPPTWILCFVCYDWPNRLRFGQVLLRRRIRRWPLHMDVLFYGSFTLRMSTRRLYVILFVFSFRVIVISYYLLCGVLWWQRSVCLLPPDGVKINTTFQSLLLIILLSSPP